MALVSPAVAAAAQRQDEELPSRVRLRAVAPEGRAAAAVTPAATNAIGDAVAVAGSWLDPVDHYSRLIAVTAQRTEERQKAHARQVRRARREAREARAEEERLARLPGGVSIGTLEAIAACESGGNPEAVSPDGTYRGKYQFDQGTWESVGGSGDPAAAPEAEQDYRAALLYSEAGSSPWPVCG